MAPTCPSWHLMGSMCNWHGCLNLGANVLPDYSIPLSARNIKPPRSVVPLSHLQAMEQAREHYEKKLEIQQAQNVCELLAKDRRQGQARAESLGLGASLPQDGFSYQQHMTKPQHMCGTGFTSPVSYSAQTPMQPGNSSAYPASLRGTTEHFAAPQATWGNSTPASGSEKLSSICRGRRSSTSSNIQYAPCRDSKKQPFRPVDRIRSSGLDTSTEWQTLEEAKQIRHLAELGTLQSTSSPRNTNEPASSKSDLSGVRDLPNNPGYDRSCERDQKVADKTKSDWNCLGIKRKSDWGSNVKAENGQFNEGCNEFGWDYVGSSKSTENREMLRPSVSYPPSYKTNHYGSTKYAETRFSWDSPDRATDAKFEKLDIDGWGSEKSEEISHFGKSCHGYECSTLPKSYDDWQGAGWEGAESDKKAGIAEVSDRSKAAFSVCGSPGWSSFMREMTNSIYSDPAQDIPSYDRAIPVPATTSSEMAILRSQVANLEKSICYLEHEVCNAYAKPSNSLSEIEFLRGLVISGTTDRETMHRVEVKVAEMAGRSEAKLPREIDMRGNRASSQYGQGGQETFTLKW